MDEWQRFASRGEYNTGWMIGITNAGGGFVTLYGKTTLELGKWYNIAGVLDSGTRQVYIYFNGTLDNNPMVHSGEMMNPGVPTTIGKSGVAHVYDFHGCAGRSRHSNHYEQGARKHVCCFPFRQTSYSLGKHQTTVKYKEVF